MLVDEMVSLCKELGLQKVKVRGDNVMYCCPFHGEHNPSCGISASKEVGGCFACGQHFNLIQLVAHCRSCSILQAIEFLNATLNRDFRNVNKTSLKLYGETEVKEEFLSYTSLAPFRSGEITHPYLLRRGFEESDFINFNLGWDNDKKRITIPFFNEQGLLLGFSGRAVLEKQNENYFNIYGADPKYYIYNNFKAKEYFYPLDKFVVKDNSLILVEGLLDAIWLHKFGYTNTLSLVSAQISKKQVSKLKALDIKKIILCLDNDVAGQEGCKKLYDRLKNDFLFFKAELPKDKKDVQECNEEELECMFSNVENYPKRIFKMYE